MRRLVPRLRLLALLVASLLLWLAPRFTGSTPPTAGPGKTSAASPEAARVTARPLAKVRPAATAPVAPPAPGTVFKLADEGASRDYAVALDELYFPSRPASRRLEKIDARADLPSLLAHVDTLSSASPSQEAPRLVLYPVGAERDAVNRRIVNPRIEVVFASADTPSPALRPDLGIVAWERPAYAPDRGIARIVGDAAQPLRAALAAAGLPGVRSARPLLARQHFTRRLTNDPMLGSQWHLGAIRATPAWDSATGSGIVIAVIDDGVDLAHPDLAPALDNALGYDWNDNDSNPSAEDHTLEYEGEFYPVRDNHGTAVAGLAGARGNNRIGVAGSAPSATLAAHRLIAAPTDDSEQAGAMTWGNDVIAVKNNSWGPSDAFPNVRPAPDLWLSAVADGASNARGGLGVLYFWAAGNGQDNGDQGTLDGYATARHVIAVAATSQAGGAAYFSEGGPHIAVAAPGESGIVTTDRVGSPGYTRSAYTSTFNGTSAATPIAAGVGALLLEARPDLGWRDVKEILLRSSTKLLAGSSDWVSRDAGDPTFPIKHHPRLGGGNVNALQALTLARTWTPLATETLLVPTPSTFGPISIPDNGAVTITFEVPYGSPLLRVEHVVLTLDVTHPFRGDLEINLTSPSGVGSRFTRVSGRLAGENYTNYPFTSVRHWGEPAYFPEKPSRRWTLTIRDAQTGDTGFFNSASLSLYGTPLAEPAVVTPPADQALATGSTLVLRGGFSGGNLSYVWRRDDQIIPGAVGPEYRVANFSAKHAGFYTCTATNTLGSASAEAEITLDDGPRGTFDIRAGTTTALDLSGYVDGDVALWKSGPLPAGLRLDPLTGLLSGRPTKPGTYNIVVSATKHDKALVRIPLSFTIAPIAPGLVGGYVALVSRDSTLNADLGGAVSLTTSANGAVSGLLMLGKNSHPFTGLLDGTDPAAATLTLTLGKPAFRLDLAITTIDGIQKLTGQIKRVAPSTPSEASAEALVDGQKSSWKISTNPATAFVGTTAAAFVCETPDVPKIGAAVVTFKVTPDGRASWLVTPPDGSPAISGSAPITDQGRLLAYVPYASGLGSFLAVIPAPTAASPALSSEAFLDWERKPSSAFALPEGFESTIHVPYAGSGRYTKPASGVRILGLSADNPAAVAALAESADLIDSASPLPAAITVTAANILQVAAPNPSKLALGFASDTGRVIGTYLAGTPARTARITAVTLPLSSPAVALGFAFTPSATGVPPGSAVLVLAPAAD